MATTVTGLPISRLVNVQVSLSQVAAQAQSLNQLLILGSSNVIDVQSRIAAYTSIAQVAAAFGTTAPEYLASVLWFEQVPQPSSLLIGRWAQTATAAELFCAPLTAAQQAIANFTAINNGSFSITINGTVHAITGLNFTGAANLNAVASDITTNLVGAAGSGTLCVWNANLGCFVISTATTGTGATISFMTAGSTEDVSTLLGGTAGSSGAYLAQGLAAETGLQAVTIFDARFGQQWYAVTVLGDNDTDLIAIANYIESATNQHFLGVTTQEAGVLTSTTTDIAALMQAGGYNNVAVQYSSTNPYAVVSLLARILTTDYTGNNTTITLFYKQEPGITAETLSATQIGYLEGKNANVFVQYNNNTAIIEPGVASSGEFIDAVMEAAALGIDIQTALYNVLYTSTTKIPQTDAGQHILTTAIEAVCSQYVNNGSLAPGVWQSGGFGTLSTGDFLDKGYYVYTPSVVVQSAAQRASRTAGPFQIAAKLAGAVHKVNVMITVNN